MASNMSLDPTVIEFNCRHGGSHAIAGEIWYRIAEARGSDAGRYQLYMCDAVSMLVHTQDDCNAILGLLDSVISDRSDEESYGLNDTVVTFRAAEAQVDILIDDDLIGSPAGRFGLLEFRKVICAWREFFRLPEGHTCRLLLELP